ncbi:Proton-coupled amino acid transporter 1 [Eufriesea mexicana]|uniref:Proton-coupled amino acid transporter 1 n=1 Tax=Eufriesea mexicana TaxID=516756 RepID=A0A310ST83_9HYME|nr:Proton-coupled amino acid transporter 1 [Eufriesea mexicana]
MNHTRVNLREADTTIRADIILRYRYFQSGILDPAGSAMLLGTPEHRAKWSKHDLRLDCTKIASVSIGEFNEKDELYNPFEHRDKKNTNSDFGSLAHLLKSSLGTGILAMPHAIKNGGVVFGGIGTILIGIICAHCVHILVRTSHVLCKRTKTPQMTYAETAQAAFLCGPKPLRPFANASRIFVNAALCATYVGGSCVYLVFVSTSLKQVVDYYSNMIIPIRLYILTLIPAVLLLGQVRNLKYMVPFSIMANLCMIVGFAITLYYIFNGIEISPDVKLIAPVKQWPTFLATVLFAIEGIGVVMPVENSMRNPHHFLGCPSVLNITMTIVVSLYTTLGVCGYLKYGAAVLGSITLNLTTTEIPGQIVKLLIALAVLFSYGLQYFVPMDIMWNSMKDMCSHKYQGISQTAMRIVMVLFTSKYFNFQLISRTADEKQVSLSMVKNYRRLRNQFV